MAGTGGVISKFKELQFDDDKISRLQDECARTIGALQSVPLLAGHAIKGVTLVTGAANAINHGLGRPLVGWLATRRRSTATIYDMQDQNPIPDRTLLLTASAGDVIDLWVF